jgi:uncharacterized repeat protein (TIGR01451 family)
MRNLIFAFILSLVQIIYSQNIVQVEYFIDSDPGFGYGTQVSITPGVDLELNFDADLSDLEPGMHRLFVRAKDQNGRWGIPLAKRFEIAEIPPSSPNIGQTEYFIDNDPGFGYGKQVSIFPGVDLDIKFDADLNGLDFGMHRLFVRAKDQNGHWSIPIEKRFEIAEIPPTPPNITSIEYYLEQSGDTTATKIFTDFTPSDTINVNFVAGLAGLPGGTTNLHLYGIDETNTPGLEYVHEFELENPFLFNFTLTETASLQSSTIQSTLESSQPTFGNITISGDLTGVLDFDLLDKVKITDGPFAGSGFMQCNWTATIESAEYHGNWKVRFYYNSSTQEIVLKGTTEGEIRGICSGSLTESTPESGIYDHYQSTWRLIRVGDQDLSATVILEGTITDQGTPVEYPAVSLRVDQLNLSGNSDSENYSGPLSGILTQILVEDEGNPYNGLGLSSISYHSDRGSGEGWTVDEPAGPQNIWRLRGQFEGPLSGIVTGIFDRGQSPKILNGFREPLDIYLAPRSDLKVNVWGTANVSPGQTVNYVIEYKNNGTTAADRVVLFNLLDPPFEFISASSGADYNDFFNTVSWIIGPVLPKTTKELGIQVKIPWGLSQGTTLGSSTFIVEGTGPSNGPCLFVNGIDYKAGSAMETKYEEFTKSINAFWVPVYYSGNREWDALHVQKATPNGIIPFEPTIYNGLKNPLITEHYYDCVYAYSGGTRTVLTAIRYYNLRCKKLVLISPISGIQIPSDTYRREIEDAVNIYGVEEIIIYQSSKDKLWIGGLYQEKFDPIDPWLNENNITLIDEEFPGPSGDMGHLLLFIKVNDMYCGKEGSSSTALSTIITAADPNEKIVNPIGNITPGQTLYYTINYENEGEGIAFGVYITDELDEDIDIATLVINSEGDYDPDTRIITWFIGQVDPHQTGSVTFSAAMRADAEPATDIINYATVYFPSVPEITRTNGVVSVYQPPYLTVDPSNQDVDFATGQTGFDVSSNISWNIDESEGWLSVDPMNGSGYGTLTVDYDENTGTIERIGTITVSGDGMTQDVTVTQKGGIHFTYNPTEDYYPLVIDSVAHDEQAIVAGDEIGVFFKDDNNQLVCGGSLAWPNSGLNIWGDDLQTPEKDGFITGEELFFMLWDASTQIESGPPDNVNYVTGNGTWGDGPFAQISLMEFGVICSITMDLNEGWNWISSNITPPDPDVEVIWTGTTCLEIVKGYDGFFVPGVYNGIGDWDISQMYSAYLSCPASLMIEGECVDPALPIALAEEWNWAGYFPAEPINAEIALASITDYLNIAKAYHGFYIPGLFNGIGNMEAGQGYKLHTSEACTLVYPSGGALAKRIGSEKLSFLESDSCEYFNDFKTTEEYQAVLIQSLDGNGLELDSKDELGIFNESGLCVGGIVLTDLYPLGLMAWKDDPRSDILDGFKTGETMMIKYWDASEDVNYKTIITVEEGSEQLGESVLTKVSLEVDLSSSSALPTTYSLDQNYPNPFNPTTKIKFALPEEQQVQIKIYDIIGKVVDVLIERKMKAGYHEIEFNAQDIASGVYFYRIKAGDFVNVKKMVVLK